MSYTTKPRLSGRLFVAFAVTALVGSTAQAQEKLRWKFKVGENLNYTMVQKMNMSMTVMGQNIDMKMNQTMEMIWKASKVAPDGTTDLSQTITRVQFTLMGGPIGKIEYDSAKPAGGGGNPILGSMTKLYDALVGKEIKMKMSPLGEIKNVEMPKKFLNTLGNAGGGQIPGMFNKDTLKQMVNQAGIRFPAAGVTKGKSWNSGLDMKNQFGVIKVNMGYKYLGSQARGGATLAKIEITPKMTMTPKPGAPFAIKLAKQSGSGIVLFDSKAGHLSSSTLNQKMVMQVNVGGQNLQQTIDQTVEMKLGSARKTR